MLIILRQATKRKISKGFRMIVTMVVISMIVGHLYNMYHGNNFIRQGWIRDDRPSGNPMRVQNDKNTLKKDNQNALDQFVVDLRGFYRRDR